MDPLEEHPLFPQGDGALVEGGARALVERDLNLSGPTLEDLLCLERVHWKIFGP